MKKVKLKTIYFVALVFFTILVTLAESKDKAETQRFKPQSVPDKSQEKDETKQSIKETTPTFSDVKVRPISVPERSAPKGLPRDYKMVTDVLDGFGQASSSTHYRIPVNSGGQPSAIGISSSTNYRVRAGYVYSSYVYHGDANADGVIDIGDVVYLINYLFKGGLSPHPLEAGDGNCDLVVDIGDVVYLINYLFKGGPPPAC